MNNGRCQSGENEIKIGDGITPRSSKAPTSAPQNRSAMCRFGTYTVRLCMKLEYDVVYVANREQVIQVFEIIQKYFGSGDVEYVSYL